jgi:signal transduction histidine kinase
MKLASCVKEALAVAVLLCILLSPLCAAEPETKVLFLHGADPYAPAQLIIDKAMRDELTGNTSRQFRFFAEAMDAQRFVFGDYEREFVSLLARKYMGIRIDIIVATTKQGLDFAIRHRSAMWPDAQILFYSVSARAIESTALGDRTAGLTLPRKIAETVDLARRLQPDARRLVVIAGVSELDKDVTEEARKVLPARSEGLELEFLLGLPQTELLDRVAQEPASSIVLFLLQIRDREGRQYASRDVVRSIAAASGAPVYGYVDSFLGEGIVGGMLISYDDLGRMIAQRLLQFAAGAPVPVLADVPSRCIADARALEKWSLNQSNLPAGCEVRFVPWSVWDAYRWQIVSVFVLVLVQALLIFRLLLERRRRWRAAEQMGQAKVETRQHRENLAHLVRVHTAGEMSIALTHEINQPLVAIKNYALAARRRMAGDRTEGAVKLQELLDKIEGQASRAGDVLQSMRAMVKKHESETARVEAGELVADALSLVEMEGRSKDVRIESAIAHNLPPVLVDRIQIQQVVLNLTRNAIEAAEEAGISGSVIKVGVAETAKNEIAVSVTDNGPGIAPADAEHIFDPFYSTKGEGLGVGLSISRAIIEAHGGRLSLAPNPGGGCVFRFTLPAAS